MTSVLTKAIVIRLDEELYDALRERAAHDERTVAQAIRFAIGRYIAGQVPGN